MKNRVAAALRLAAHSLHHADNYLGEFHRRMKRKLGPAASRARLAAAHRSRPAFSRRMISVAP